MTFKFTSGLYQCLLYYYDFMIFLNSLFPFVQISTKSNQKMCDEATDEKLLAYTADSPSSPCRPATALNNVYPFSFSLPVAPPPARSPPTIPPTGRMPPPPSPADGTRNGPRQRPPAAPRCQSSPLPASLSPPQSTAQSPPPRSPIAGLTTDTGSAACSTAGG